MSALETGPLAGLLDAVLAETPAPFIPENASLLNATLLTTEPCIADAFPSVPQYLSGMRNPLHNVFTDFILFTKNKKYN